MKVCIKNKIPIQVIKVTGQNQVSYHDYKNLEDFIILRSDNTPMLAVVVDTML